MAYYDDIKARPTTYKGVQMRSRLEAKFAAWLDEWGWQWSYEPQCFAGDGGQYLPDFQTDMGGFLPERSYIEVKPDVADADEALRRMHVVLESEPSASLFVYSEVDNAWQRRSACTPFVQGRGSAECRCKRARVLRPDIEPSVADVLSASPWEGGWAGPDIAMMRCAYCDNRYTHLVGVEPFAGGSDAGRFGVRLAFGCETCPAITIVSFTNWKGDTEVMVKWVDAMPDGAWVGPGAVGAS
jgi:hypothetical protein